MSAPDLGWAWFETNSPSSDHEKPSLDHDLANVFARCFRGEEGIKVLKHLKHITHSRILGPTAPDALLRHMEGQRQLVAHIISLVDQGRTHGQAGDPTHAQSGSTTMENAYD